MLNWKINIHKFSHLIMLLFKDLPSFATFWTTLAWKRIDFRFKGTSSICEIFPAASQRNISSVCSHQMSSGTYKHEPCGDVVWLHQGIFVQPDLLWLDHSLEWIQKLRKTEKMNERYKFFTIWSDDQKPPEEFCSFRISPKFDYDTACMNYPY